MTINELKNAVTELSPEDQQSFRKWFVSFDSAAWDQQIESDLQAGKLNSLAEEALAAHRSGKSQEL